MSIVGFVWDSNQGFDVHVLRNNKASLPLDEIAIVIDQQPPSNPTFNSVKDINSGAATKPSDFDKVQFIPRFIGTVTANVHKGNGIEVDLTTGAIKASTVTGNKISNFVVDA